jgi:osmotically inducible protein OsmC
MPILSTISGTTVGGRDGHGETSDGLLKADFKSRGGGPTPEHFFALGYSACFGSALSGVCRMKQVQLPPDFSVTVKVDLNQGENHNYSLLVELQVSLPGIERDQAEELVKAADQMCPYSKAIRNNVPVKLTVL